MNSIIDNFIFLLKRFKTVSIINIFGLSAAFAVFIIMLIQISYDLGYNKSFKNSDKIFTEVSRSELGEEDVSSYWSVFSINEMFSIMNNVPEIENYVQMRDFLNDHCPAILADGREIWLNDDDVKMATSGFMTIFTPKILVGDTDRVFTEQGRGMISRKMAERIFGEQYPVGNSIYIPQQETTIFIDAVYEDFPENSSVKNVIYIKHDENYPDMSNNFTCFMVDPQNVDIVNSKINSDAAMGPARAIYYKEHPERRRVSSLLPFTNYYKDKNDNYVSKQERMKNIMLMVGVAVLAIIVAFINYINMAFAMVPSRVKNINVRKILGANMCLQRTAIAMEGAFIAIISFLMALLAVHFFSRSSMSEFFMSKFLLEEYKWIIVLFGGILSIVMFLLSLWVAYYSTSFKVSVSLNSSYLFSHKGAKMRSMLIAFQYITAIVFICVAVFIKIQHDYMVNHSWGLKTDNVICVELWNSGVDYKVLGEELKRNSSIVDYTAGTMVGQAGIYTLGSDVGGKTTGDFRVWEVAPEFLTFFGIDILAGENFSYDNAPSIQDGNYKRQAIVNRQFLLNNGLDESIIGEEARFNGDPDQIVGVCTDVNFESLHQPIGPMAFRVRMNCGNMFIRLAPGNPQDALSYIEKTWEKFTDKKFIVKFLDDEMQALYTRENNMAKLIGLFGLIVIIIAVMGIYSLITFNVKTRTKEIGIRKVNGASETEIMLMLNKNLLAAFFVAFVIAVPLVYFIIQKWLEGFAYQAPVPWWLIFVAGLIVFVISIIAVSCQTWKAANANPIDSIRTE